MISIFGEAKTLSLIKHFKLINHLSGFRISSSFLKANSTYVLIDMNFARATIFNGSALKAKNGLV